MKLLLLADKFHMPFMLRLCEDYLVSSSFVSSATFHNNVLKWTALAEKLGLQRLWNHCEYTLAVMQPRQFLEVR